MKIVLGELEQNKHLQLWQVTNGIERSQLIDESPGARDNGASPARILE
jgi:hypothetical protein